MSIVGIIHHADVAFADTLLARTLRIGVKVLHVFFCQPETEAGGEILACANRTSALHERLTVEVLQAASC